MEIPTFSRNLTNARAAIPYPHVEIVDRTESVALMLQGMNGGELPIVFSANGAKVQIAKVPLSAVSIYTLLRVSKLIWRADSETEVELFNTEDIMHVLGDYTSRSK